MIFDGERTYQQLVPLFGRRVKRDEQLSRHSTFGVGGPADIWVTIETREELEQLVSLSMKERWPLFCIGNGTNVLFADSGIRGIVARIALNTYTLEDFGDGTALLKAGAGVSWPKIINELAKLGWGGLEFGPGIPGTLGGGVVSNAGAHHGNIGEVLEWVEVLDAVEASELPGAPVWRHYAREALDLSYRHSRFRSERRIQFTPEGYPLAAPRLLVEPGEIITQVGIRLHQAEPDKLKETIEAYKHHRKTTQPTQGSAGSVFKNPPGDSSGRLIEAAGLKGYQLGGAQISEKHANFIINAGGATAADVAALIQAAYTRVRDQFGITLELEVELRGEWKAETT